MSGNVASLKTRKTFCQLFPSCFERESQGLETEKGGNNIVVPFMLDLAQSHAGTLLWDSSVLSDCFLIPLCWKQLLFLWARPLIICCQSCDSSLWVYWVIRDVRIGRLCRWILTSQRLRYRIGHVLQLLCQTHSDSNFLAVWKVNKAHHYSLIRRRMPFAFTQPWKRNGVELKSNRANKHDINSNFSNRWEISA